MFEHLNSWPHNSHISISKLILASCVFPGHSVVTTALVLSWKQFFSSWEIDGLDCSRCEECINVMPVLWYQPQPTSIKPLCTAFHLADYLLWKTFIVLSALLHFKSRPALSLTQSNNLFRSETDKMWISSAIAGETPAWKPYNWWTKMLLVLACS